MGDRGSGWRLPGTSPLLTGEASRSVIALGEVPASGFGFRWLAADSRNWCLDDWFRISPLSHRYPITGPCRAGLLGVMTTHGPPIPLRDPRVVDVLVLFQATLVAVSAVEATVIGAATGFGVASPAILSVVLAVVLLVIARRSSKRMVRGIQWFLLTSAAVDLVLAVALGRTLLDPVALMTRIALPVSILRLSPKRAAS